MKKCKHVWKMKINRKNNYIFPVCIECKEPMRTPVGTIAGRYLCVLLKEE